MPKVTFLPVDLTVDGLPGQSLLEIARQQGVPVATACVGKATCGLCRLKVEGGEAGLTPFNSAEKKHLGNVYFITKERLACQARLCGGDDDPPVVVRVPPIEKLRG
jgi:ferredoxin, 2Fe-2S